MTPKSASSQPAVIGYTILCLTALLTIVLALTETDHELLWILLLASVGTLGVMARWRKAPLLLLVGLAVLELYHRATWVRSIHNFDSENTGFIDAVLSAAVLAFCVGQYRLVSLTHSIFPIDRRRPLDAKGPFDSRQQRSPHLPQTWEMIRLAITALVWAAAVSVFWLMLSAILSPLEESMQLWRGLLLIYSVGLATALLGAAVVYLDWTTATLAEHLLFLQDQAWRETRREQSQINRWLTWARLRGQGRKEKT